MSFTKLPSELQIEVFSNLSNKDLKNVRAVSTCCRDNASVWLFRSIIACARYQAMGAFQKISLHPIYREYVKEVVFDATEYDRALAENEHEYQRNVDNHNDLKHTVGWFRHAKFKQYQQLYRDQEAMKDDGILLHTVAKAFEWMPHVHSIVYCARPRHIPIEKKDMRDILPRVFWHMPPRRFSWTTPENGFHHLIGAVALARYTKVREFHVDPYPLDYSQARPDFGFGFKDFLFANPDYLESGKCFFRNLTRVELALTAKTPHSLAPMLLEVSRNMRTLLSEAKELRHLGVRMDLFANLALSSTNHRSSFAHFGLSTEWQKLQSINIEGIHATEDELHGLVHRGRYTLESMEFSRCVLTSGKWSNIVEEVVYGTQIGAFVLNRVNEEYVGDERFATMSSEDAEQWYYEGEVGRNAKGERCFEERPGKSVYAWRNLLTGTA
ncbi:hypothetical protein BU23DRAFT_514387 [Bimuria novae-zelandiae CBS 107.79]|uniref:F-box domain-containing protein n=1 Tax=Bimuria novae-zelandiae CBS 107.79 TaxID=1447943 RepID=A0A6A5UTT9_9PLEO|nr:hypothetical protein BU23DRAFT_514387 [Bimuria novae-zelandiae CBS 107.79]